MKNDDSFMIKLGRVDPILYPLNQYLTRIGSGSKKTEPNPKNLG